MRPPEDEALLRDMLAYTLRAVEAVATRKREDLDSDPILAAALEPQEALATDPWREIVGMRNRLVHGYASVDHDIVWDVVSADLAGVGHAIEALLAESVD